jgi:hypothetical protein
LDAGLDPKTAEQLRLFWEEVGNDAMYDIGLSRQIKDSCLTPIYLFVKRSSVFPDSYLSTMSLNVDLVAMGNMSDEAFRVSIQSRLLSTGILLKPEDELQFHFRFARLETLEAEADSSGYFRKQLSVFGRIPNLGSLPYRGEFRLVITRPPKQFDPLVLRPCPPIGAGR